MSGQAPAEEDLYSTRSGGGSLVRGIILIIAAVVLGVVLLKATDAPDPFAVAGADGPGTTDPAETDDTAEGETTSSTVAGTDSTTPATVAGDPPADPATVTVLVANGARVQGLAGTVSDLLKAANYVTAPPANALGSDVLASVIYFTPGFEAEAAAIAALLAPPPAVAALPAPPPVADMRGANILVVAGPELAG